MWRWNWQSSCADGSSSERSRWCSSGESLWTLQHHSEQEHLSGWQECLQSWRTSYRCALCSVLSLSIYNATSILQLLNYTVSHKTDPQLHVHSSFFPSFFLSSFLPSLPSHSSPLPSLPSLSPSLPPSLLPPSLPSFLSYLGDTRSLHMPVLRPASQAGPMRSPREGTSVVFHDTIRLTWWCV